jgi:hypothetical protein
MLNPFKPHIVEFDRGGFAVRRLGLLGWRYLDNYKYLHKTEKPFWWLFPGPENIRYWRHDSIEDARSTLHQYTSYGNFTNQVKKVYL